MFCGVVPGAGIEPARLAAGDFESPASTNFTTRAVCSEAADYDTGQSALVCRHGPNSGAVVLMASALQRLPNRVS